MMKAKTTYNVISDCRGLYENEIINTILSDRGIKDVEHFLNPNEGDLLPLDSLENVDMARKIVENGIDCGFHFGILWDTDTDGATSGAIMTRYLMNFTKAVSPFINEGKSHGLIGQDIDRFNDCDIVIIVDSLDKDITQYRELVSRGKEVVVLDHHAIDQDVPYDEYITLVSSQRNYDNLNLSGAGVVWKFCKYLDQYFMEDYADDYADLAACGLVADMMDVSENSMENRYIIEIGLDRMINPAIKKIVGSFPFNSTAISFSIAPLINAANRMNRNVTAMNAFLADDNKEVLKYIKELKKCKEEQNEEVEKLMDNIIVQADGQLDKKVISIFINSENGISGLIGNKLLERYQRPLLILKEIEIDGEKYYAGSARAIGIDDFRKLCNETGVAEANGHELAFGIQVKAKKYGDFISKLEESLENIEIKMARTVDIELDISDITRDLIDKIKTIDKISGTGFKPITVKVSDITEYEVGSMSQGKHLVLKPTDYLQLIKWNWNGSFDDMEDNAILEEPITVIGKLDSGWLGRTFSLKIICDEVKVVA